MAVTSRTDPDPDEARHLLNVITKVTNHPLSAILLGEVVGVLWRNDSMLLYYSDGREALLFVDDEGDIMAEDHKLPSC